jgi:mRNA-decapping enzyme subunit 2
MNSAPTTFVPPLDPSAAQESSSQSSDPLTPSPQYTEPMTYVADSSTSQPETVDPHLARLLSNLRVSTPSDKPAPTKPEQISISPQPARPSSVHNLNQTGLNPPSPMPQRQAPSEPAPSQSVPPQQPTTPVKPPPLPPSNPSALSASLTPPNVLRSRRTSSTADISPYLSRPS